MLSLFIPGCRCTLVCPSKYFRRPFLSSLFAVDCGCVLLFVVSIVANVANIEWWLFVVVVVMCRGTGADRGVWGKRVDWADCKEAFASIGAVAQDVIDRLLAEFHEGICTRRIALLTWTHGPK